MNPETGHLQGICDGQTFLGRELDADNKAQIGIGTYKRAPIATLHNASINRRWR
jgi:hypothetical protein